jgi:hypothetical protein
MTNKQHPITPPPELVQQWEKEAVHKRDYNAHLATRAAQWGSDQELEGCCEWLDRNNQWARCDIDELRDGRRPKPPSLKEQALAEVHISFDKGYLKEKSVNLIRRALEQLDD